MRQKASVRTSEPLNPGMNARAQRFYGVALSLGLSVSLWGAGCSGEAPEESPTPTVTPAAESPTPQPTVTWHGQIQPLVEKACIQCHVDGGIAPFSLETYETAKNWSPVMNIEVQAGTMPPWLPSDQCQSFLHARVLTSDEKALFQSWYEQGSPEGVAPSSSNPTSEPAEGPELEWVDTTVEMSAAYTPTGTLQDEYQCFIMDPKTTEDEFIVGFEVLPGTLNMVHHVLVYSADPGEAQAQDAADPAIGWQCFGGPGVSDPSLVGAWVPGSPPTVVPAGTGVGLEAGRVLVMQIHYNLDNTAPVADLTSMKLQYAREKVTPAIMTPIGNGNFTIPPNTSGYQVTATVTLDRALKVWGLAPHMHTAGVSINATYKRGGTDTCLVDIPRWDFHWQQFYFYGRDGLNQYVDGKKGDVVTLTCTFDNPLDVSIQQGEGTSDEMCLSYFYVTL